MSTPRLGITSKKATVSLLSGPLEFDFQKGYPLICFRALDGAFFPGRAATIYYRSPPSVRAASSVAGVDVAVQGDVEIGTLGVLHPSVLEKFEIGYPCSALEFNLEPFKKEMQTVWTD